MKNFKIVVISFICIFMLAGTVAAEENALKGMKLGFGFDQGFGVAATLGKFNGFLGNDGVAVDYILVKKNLSEVDLEGLHWYVGGGGYIEWDGAFGARIPVGAELYFAENLDVYAQIIPRLQFNNNSNNNQHNDNVDFGLDFGIGVRYQF
jgi:hypothetical protein